MQINTSTETSIC